MINVIITKFNVNSEAFEAYSNVKADPMTNSLTISQSALIEKTGTHIELKERFDTGVNTGNDAFAGGLIGSLFGILTGPLGVLFWGGFGALAGSAIDADDAVTEMSLGEEVIGKMSEDGMYLMTIADENDQTMYDSKIGKFDCVTTRFDAAEVQAEIDHAREVEASLKKQAKKELRDKQKADFKAKAEAKRAEIKAKFDAFKEKNNL
ncbi:cell envelope integrity protein TolA [Butyrivibrio sp. INlla16]|uniref:cell envelope integrity protein TolA n=1 Tax=Butyrivibrio sp. INlla16 TaxID=1520807 RepID=UPI0008905C47|nr:cell envelope integrity protein TolA [Butyrivibrio sp. INlla16]SDB50104.1 hypothetical protein SAMN02910263_02501 [Butyrivibrio sp. INlla16]